MKFPHVVWRLSRRATIFGVLFFAFLLFSASMLVSHEYRSYNSDDVAQQTILKDAGASGGKHQLYLGNDNFIIHMPLYELMQNVVYGTRTNLFWTSYILSAGGYALFLWAAWWLLRHEQNKKRQPTEWLATLAPLIWPATLGMFFFAALLNPNLRNVEFGLAFAGLVGFIYTTTRKNVQWAKSAAGIAWGVGVGLLGGLFLYNDPYFEYVFFLPMALLSALILWRKRAWLFVYPLAVIALSVIVAHILPMVAKHLFGIVTNDPPTQFATLEAIPGQIMIALSGLLQLLNANFFGQNAIGTHTVLCLVYLAPIIALVLAYRDKGVKSSIKTSLLHQFLLLQIATTAILYVISTNSQSTSTARYFIAAIFSAALLACVVIMHHSNRTRALKVGRGLAGLVVLVAIVQLGLLFAWRHTPSAPRASLPSYIETTASNPANDQNHKTAKVLHSQNITKGYATYWDANINTFFSGNTTHVLPVTCSPTSGLHRYLWLLDSYWLDKHADNSFFLYDTESEEATSGCITPQNLQAQFGPADRIVYITPTTSLYVYGYDILDKIGQ